MDTHQQHTQCGYKGCTRAPAATPVTRAGRGMCRPHSLTILVLAADIPRPHHPREWGVSAEPYIRWTQAVSDSRAVEWEGHVVDGMSTRDLASMVGITRTVFSDLTRGERMAISRNNALRLDPWVYGTRPGPSTRRRVQTIGPRVDGPVQARGLPRGSVLLDRYGRSWQMGRHRLGTGMDTDLDCPTVPSYPCRVLYIPPVTSANTRSEK